MIIGDWIENESNQELRIKEIHCDYVVGLYVKTGVLTRLNRDEIKIRPEMFCPVDLDRPWNPPIRATAGSIGFDLFVSVGVKLEKLGDYAFGKGGRDLFLPEDELVDNWLGYRLKPTMVETNTRCNFPQGWGGLLRARSSMAKQGVHCLGGVIDNDYKGELKIIVYSFGANLVLLAGERLAQLILVPYYSSGRQMSVERGASGFGSTGK